jgi:antitoxin FitA
LGHASTLLLRWKCGFDIMISEVTFMAQILIRNLPDDVKVRLKRRAEARGVSLEAEAREILQKSANESMPPISPDGKGMGTKFAEHLATLPAIDDETWTEFQANLAEVRNLGARPVDLDE